MSGEVGQVPTFVELAGRPRAHFEAILRAGEPPDFRALAGWEYRGVNTPRAVQALGLRKFIKGFYLDEGGRSLGYNVRVTQDGLGDPWTAVSCDAAARRSGFFSVGAVDPRARERAYPRALLLDYSARGNRDISRLLRDYLVRVIGGSDELLVGKAHLALGPLRVPVSYFVLERLQRAPSDGA
jgi:hypothetical protein